MSYVETPLQEVIPKLLVAIGNEAMVRVWRDPLFIPLCNEYERAKQFIAANGLVLTETEEIDDDTMLSGRCFCDTYMTPDMRMAAAMRHSNLTKENDD